jgi:hypothetical protein
MIAWMVAAVVEQLTMVDWCQALIVLAVSQLRVATGMDQWGYRCPSNFD